MLAVQGLVDTGAIERGQKILLNGAGGGVGTFALQILKPLGLKVTVVDTAAKLDMLRSLGAAQGIDYNHRLHEDWQALRPDPRHQDKPIGLPLFACTKPRRKVHHPRRFHTTPAPVLRLLTADFAIH